MSRQIACSAGLNGTLLLCNFMSDRTPHLISTAPANELIARLKSAEDSVSAAACQSAWQYGATVVKPIVALMAGSDFELARKAKRALQWMVHHAGRPGASREARAIEEELVALLNNGPTQVRRDLVWVLSEIGSTRAIGPLAALLSDPDVREDARCALTRHPDRKAAAALKAAFGTAPEDFKYALAESLRERGQKVEGYPSRKLVPTAQTTVTPVQPKKS
jgi:HEAT repeat protein